MSKKTSADTLPVRIVGACTQRVWGATPDVWLMRAFRAEGAEHFLTPQDPLPESGEIVLLRADAVLDRPVVKAILNRPGQYLLYANEGPDSNESAAKQMLAARVPVGLAGRTAELLSAEPPSSKSPSSIVDDLDAFDAGEFSGAYWHDLRKRAVPLAARVTAQTLPALEWRMFMSTYKGVTDAITKYVWPRPAFWTTKLCVSLGITPNTVTFVSLLLVIAAFFLFLDGAWAFGLIAAWLMTFLDTVDGKLARVTYSYSKFGNFFDHGIDLIHPPFWYVAWGLGSNINSTSLEQTILYWLLGVILVGYVVQRIVEGLFILFFRIEIHVWRPFDSFFRLITARRNPNLVILTAATLFGRPDLGLAAVAVWTAASLLVHLVQLAQAGFAARRGQALTSWLSASAAP